MKTAFCAGVALLGAATAAVAAQPLPKDYPDKPIRVVVPSPPGGPPDLIIRMLAPTISVSMGQQLVVDNRPGAGGVVGSATVAKAAPDGYTWLFTTASHVNTPPFNKHVPFDPVRDFSHVSLVAQNYGQALAVPASSPAKSVRELIALAKAHPGKLNYASAGLGTASHIPAEVMKAMAGVDIVGVQYRGTGEAMTDVLAGRMDVFFIGTNAALPYVQNGKLRVLALTGAKRWKGLPDVPTMEECGFKGYNIINWFGLWLPAHASPALMNRLHAEVVKALDQPDIKQQFDTLGLEGIGSKPAEFARFVAQQSDFIKKLAARIQKH
jgi:tripartite-type tricarboxylate transporter receptor subunit TctC